MESANDRSSKSADAAAEWNRQLARRVARWKRFRLAFVVILAGGGIAILLSGSAAVWSVPCFIGAFVACLLYLDSRDQLREIRARNWGTITPRIGRSKEPDRDSAPKGASSS